MNRSWSATRRGALAGAVSAGLFGPSGGADARAPDDGRTVGEALPRGLSVLPESAVRNAAIINSSIDDLHARGGGRLLFPPGIYEIASPIVLKRGVRCQAEFGSVIIRLRDGANCSLAESYLFSKLYGAAAYQISDHPDMTTDCGFDGFVFDGNGLNQSKEALLYGLKLYVRRPTLRNCVIENIAGVGLWTALFGSHSGGYDATKTKIPAGIDNVEIVNCRDENWVYEGPSDIPIGTVVTNGCGDGSNDGTIPQVSRHFGGSPVHSVVVNESIEANYLNLNGARFGRLLLVKSGHRVNIDSLIASGGWGLVEIEPNAFGAIDKLMLQANPHAWGGVVKPMLLNASDDMIFGAVTARRVNGQDVGGPGIVDSGGAQWGIVRSRQAPRQGGHLFVADAVNVTIAHLGIEGIGSIASDGTVSCGLVTTPKADCIDVNAHIDVASIAWRNERVGLVGRWSFTGRGVKAFEVGVTTPPYANPNCIAAGQYSFRVGSALVAMISIPESTIASASRIALGAPTIGPNVLLIGNASVSSFGEAPAGTLRRVRVSGTATLVHGPNLLCPGSRNSAMAAGDRFTALCRDGKIWEIIAFIAA